MNLLQKLILDLQNTWGYTTEESYDIKEKMIEFALAAIHDTSIQKDLFNSLDN